MEETIWITAHALVSEHSATMILLLSPEEQSVPELFRYNVSDIGTAAEELRLMTSYSTKSS